MVDYLEVLTSGTQVNRKALYLLKKISSTSANKYSSLRAGSILNKKWGSGLEFDQLREYTVGDDPRFIDWKASSRHNTIYSKQFIEDKDANFLIVIDIQDAMFFGSQKRLMSTLACYLASLQCWNWQLCGYAVAFQLISSQNVVYLSLTHKESQLSESLDKIARIHNNIKLQRNKPALSMHLRSEQWKNYEYVCIITSKLSVDDLLIERLAHKQRNKKRSLILVDDPLLTKLNRISWLSDGHMSARGEELEAIYNDKLDSLKETGIAYQNVTTAQTLLQIANVIKGPLIRT